MLEVALKLASAADDLRQLEQALLNMAGDRPPQHTTLTNTYYDTAGGELKRDGLVLRVRQQDGLYTQTVNREVTGGKGRLARSDWEDVIEGERPDLRAPNTGAHLPEAVGEAELRAQFTAVMRRTLFILEPDGSTEIAGAVDEGEIRAAESEHTEPIYEVGLLLKRGNPAALYETGLRLLEIAPLRIEVRSKAERGSRLLEGPAVKPQAQHFLPFDVKPETTVEESLRHIGQVCLALLLRNEPAALADVPDGIHQMRVAVRRLRSVVTTMKRMLPPDQYEWVSREMKWIAGVLGPARNWDVFFSSLLAPLRGASLSEQNLDRLCRITEQERQSAHEAANAAIRSPRYTAALLRLLQWFASSSWRNQPVSETSALLMAPIGTLAPSLIGRQYKKVKKSTDGFDELTPQRRHEFRIAVKKLRYTIEFLENLFDTDEVAEFVRCLKPLQDDMGYANDVRVASELLGDLRISDGAVTVARAAGVVLGWHDRGLVDFDRKLRKDVRRFRRARPFW
jgi:triphosphatase